MHGNRMTKGLDEEFGVFEEHFRFFFFGKGVEVHSRRGSQLKKDIGVCFSVLLFILGQNREMIDGSFI